MLSPLLRLKARVVVATCIFTVAAMLVAGTDEAAEKSPGMGEVIIPNPEEVNRRKRDMVSDDPEDLWEEWGETEESRRFPKRTREITEGMDIYSVMGNIMKQNKVIYAHFLPSLQVTKQVGKAVVSRFGNMMNAGGISCTLWFVDEPPKIVAKTPSVRDAYLAKDFLVDQPEVEKVVIDNVPFTPKPKAPDEDEDDDDDDKSDNVDTGNVKQEL